MLTRAKFQFTDERLSSLYRVARTSNVSMSVRGRNSITVLLDSADKGDSDLSATLRFDHPSTMPTSEEASRFWERHSLTVHDGSSYEELSGYIPISFAPIEPSYVPGYFPVSVPPSIDPSFVPIEPSYVPGYFPVSVPPSIDPSFVPIEPSYVPGYFPVSVPPSIDLYGSNLQQQPFPMDVVPSVFDTTSESWSCIQEAKGKAMKREALKTYALTSIYKPYEGPWLSLESFERKMAEEVERVIEGADIDAMEERLNRYIKAGTTLEQEFPPLPERDASPSQERGRSLLSPEELLEKRRKLRERYRRIVGKQSVIDKYVGKQIKERHTEERQNLFMQKAFHRGRVVICEKNMRNRLEKAFHVGLQRIKRAVAEKREGERGLIEDKETARRRGILLEIDRLREELFDLEEAERGLKMLPVDEAQERALCMKRWEIRWLTLKSREKVRAERLKVRGLTVRREAVVKSLSSLYIFGKDGVSCIVNEIKSLQRLDTAHHLFYELHLALSSFLFGSVKEAKVILYNLFKKDPTNPLILFVNAVFYSFTNRPSLGRFFANQLSVFEEAKEMVESWCNQALNTAALTSVATHQETSSTELVLLRPAQEIRERLISFLDKRGVLMKPDLCSRMLSQHSFPASVNEQYLDQIVHQAALISLQDLCLEALDPLLDMVLLNQERFASDQLEKLEIFFKGIFVFEWSDETSSAGEVERRNLLRYLAIEKLHRNVSPDNWPLREFAIRRRMRFKMCRLEQGAARYVVADEGFKLFVEAFLSDMSNKVTKEARRAVCRETLSKFGGMFTLQTALEYVTQGVFGGVLNSHFLIFLDEFLKISGAEQTEEGKYVRLYIAVPFETHRFYEIAAAFDLIHLNLETGTFTCKGKYPQLGKQIVHLLGVMQERTRRDMELGLRPDAPPTAAPTARRRGRR